MKKLLSLSLFVSFAFLSCSTDEDSENVSSQAEASNVLHQKQTDLNPENSANPYDVAGKLYRQILEKYYENTSPTATPSQVITEIETIANGFTDFAPMKNSPYQPVAYSNINWILNTEGSYHIVVTNSNNLSAAGKNQLEILASNLSQLLDTGAEAKSIHDHIISFEATIFSSLTLTSNDKKAILTSSSIARHANYLRRKGRRWDIHHGITGALQGNAESMAKAITTASSVNAIENGITQ